MNASFTITYNSDYFTINTNILRSIWYPLKNYYIDLPHINFAFLSTMPITVMVQDGFDCALGALAELGATKKRLKNLRAA